MDTVTLQSRTDSIVASVAELLKSGHFVEADAVLDHLVEEGLHRRLSDENKRQLFDAISTQVPFNVMNFEDGPIDGVYIARRLNDLGVLVFVFTNSEYWDEWTCLATTIVDACMEAGLPVVTQDMIDRTAQQAGVNDLMPEIGVIWYDNGPLTSGTVIYIGFEASVDDQDNFRIVRKGDSALVLEDAYLVVLDGQTKGDKLRCVDGASWHGHYYDVELTVGEPPRVDWQGDDTPLD